MAKLSGGQRQRVAIARALALSPKLFLLDEPLSALDAKLREAMQVELRQLQQRLGITTIVVTHDQREAMTMADLVVVMGEGRIRQAAAPIEIYRKPADAFVADFIGIDQSAAGRGRRRRPRGRCSARPFAGLSLPAGVHKASISVRPEDVHLTAPGNGAITGTVTFVRDLGGTIETFVEAGGKTIVAVATPRERPDVAAGQRGRHRAAARKLRGARKMRREAPKTLADYAPLLYPGGDADRVLRRAVLDHDRGQLLQAQSGRLLHAGFRLRQLRALPVGRSSAACSASR